jgi:hypothetical protein
MPGSFTYTSGSIPLARPSEAIGVFLYDAESGNSVLATNLVCLGIQFREGADPGSARFRYVFGDPLGDPNAPSRFEQVYPLDATGQGVIKNDDRLVVARALPGGTLEFLFDGFAQIPQADLDADSEVVSFTALGTPIREWDTPLGGALMRDADTPATPANDIQTNLPARFNPGGRPNATPGDVDGNGNETIGPSAKDSGKSGAKYPAFLGPVWPKNKINGETIRAWNLGMAVRYVVTQGNPKQEYITLGDTAKLDAILQAITPKDEAGPIDLTDASTYQYSPITVQDYDVTGEPWPVALERLIAPHGFAFHFALGSDSNSLPTWRVVIHRKDDALGVKSLFLQQAGNAFDPSRTNVGALHLARDIHNVANAYIVDSAPIRYECSFILAPGFDVAAGDATTLKNYVGEDADPDKYRLFVFDECGEGHWDFGSNAKVMTPGDLKPLLNQRAKTRPYVRRRRPGRHTLISTDPATRKPLTAKLHVSSDYKGDMPGIWDGNTGTWQEVDSGEWELLKDRLGIKVTGDDPNAFKIGTPPVGTTTAYPSSGKLSLVEWIATPSAKFPYPRFRLTCVVEDDAGMPITSKRRDASPTSFAITRRIDARDRFEKGVVSRFSALADAENIGSNGEDVAATDESTVAQAQADGMRRATELGVFAGSVTIPRLTTAYRIGDKIRGIEGRSVGLQTNAGTQNKETPLYPSIVSISWELDGRQLTHLDLSDQRVHPAPERSESRYD